ncbi:hypothetical protein ACLB2K_068774 [Fragaria x ananassa]
MLLHKAPMFTQPPQSKTLTRNPNRLTATISMAVDRAAVPPPPQRRRTMSALEARVSLVAALAAQASALATQYIGGIALWVKLSSQYLGLIHVSTC